MTVAAQARTPRLLLDQDEESLREAVADLLADAAPWDAVLARIDDDAADPVDAGLWSRLAVDIGVVGLPVPEDLGGSGASWREVGVVAEQLGRHVAPVPFLGAVLATAALLAVHDAGEEQEAGETPAADLLGRVAEGRTRAALVVPWTGGPTAWASEGPLPTTVSADDAGRLEGTVTAVADAVGADVLLVVAAGGTAAVRPGPGDVVLVAVDATDAVVEPRGGLDRTRTLATVALDGAAGTVLARGATAVAAVQRALLVGAAVLACEQVGLADRCLETAVAYTKERRQFGRPVGSFQALKHRMADLWVAGSQARAVARWAVDEVSEGPAGSGAPGPGPAGGVTVEVSIAAATAQAHCSPATVHAAEECVQLHGGIGFTWENPSHLYLKRAQADALALGSAAAHRAHLATLVDLPPAG